MNLSTPFPVNIISQMRAKQWRRPGEELVSGFIRKSYTQRVQQEAMRDLLDRGMALCVL